MFSAVPGTLSALNRGKPFFFHISKLTALVTDSLKCLEESVMSIKLNAQVCGFSFSGKKVLS